MRRLIVDDIRVFRHLRTEQDGGFHARTSRTALTLLNNHDWDELWLDHDLGSEDDIMPIVDYLAERAFRGHRYSVPRIFVHSQNPVGAENVMRTLRRWDYDVRRVGVDRFTV